MATAIEIHDMSVGWSGKRLFPELELRLVHGECLVIVGPGGSGKSTTLRVIEQVVYGREVQTPAEAEAQTETEAEAEAGGHGLWWRGNTITSVRSCARLRQHGEFRREPIGELLAEIGLDGDEGWMPPGEPERALLRAVLDLPLGEAPETLRRFVSVMLVAHSDAPLLLFDEPCFGLRGAWLHAVRARLQSLAQRNRTMVVVTHHLPLAQSLADQVMLIVDGQIIESARVADFFERARHPRTRQYLQWGG